MCAAAHGRPRRGRRRCETGNPNDEQGNQPEEQPEEQLGERQANQHSVRRRRWFVGGMAVTVLVVAASVLALVNYGAPRGPFSIFGNVGSGPSGTTTISMGHYVIAKHFVLERFILPALPQLPTPPPSAPTPTPCAGASPAATSSAAAATATGSAETPCVPCGTYAGTNPSQAEIIAALQGAASQYQLPVNLLLAVAWQESQWHEDITSCDGGIGLMQVQYYTFPWLNALDVPQCGISPTQYNSPSTSVEDNAFLGAKYLKWLECLYAYNGPGGGSPSAPADGGSAFLYQQVGLAYPDTQTLQGVPITAECPQATPTPAASATAVPSVTPSSPTSPPSPTVSTSPTAASSPTPTFTPGSCGLCQTLYQDNGNGPTATLFQDLPSTTNDPWSCPMDPTKGVGDYELLDLVLSAYNAGPNSISNCSCIPNLDYVGTAEYWITQFRNGALPPTATP